MTLTLSIWQFYIQPNINFLLVYFKFEQEEMDASVAKLMHSIEKCLLPKLERNCEESKTHKEYLIRKEKLTEEFPVVLDLFGDLDLSQNPALAPGVLSSLLILYEELRIDVPWNADIPQQFPKKLNRLMDVLCEVTFDDLLKKESFYDPQEVFDACMENIHRKLTPDNFKMYPATIEVYCKLVQNIKDYYITVNPQKTLPASLLLIDDYVTAHKTKGLKICAAVLQSISSNGFHNGNYYEVVYASLKNSLTVQYVDVNKLSQACLMELIRLLPAQVKTIKSGDLFVHTLDQLHSESNLLRKANNFKFSKKLIEIHGVNCVKRKKMFNTVMCDNLDTCANVAVAEMLLMSLLEIQMAFSGSVEQWRLPVASHAALGRSRTVTLANILPLSKTDVTNAHCFEEWIKHCWCVWNLKFPSDQNVLSLLLKVMYININNEKLSIKLQEILETLICISAKDDQKKILRSLESREQLTMGESSWQRDFTKSKTRLKKKAIPKLGLPMPPLSEEILEGFPLKMARTAKVQLWSCPVWNIYMHSLLQVVRSVKLTIQQCTNLSAVATVPAGGGAARRTSAIAAGGRRAHSAHTPRAPRAPQTTHIERHRKRAMLPASGARDALSVRKPSSDHLTN
ncbi:hypothetical protein MSG28_002702 [Choristoneura fumiferana]|uniref:Uncharacterized protein n=1 Tax=Choristoneura fumiferana TaxID=7141 RepID=A0ACC0JJ24_CHOFU|nr:hypothetical protein MSG28_002702 [Choristoneura fumiferana]